MTRSSRQSDTRRPPDHRKEMQTELVWSCLPFIRSGQNHLANVSHSSGLAKTILQGTVKGGRRQGRQRKRREDNIREWTGLDFAKSQRAVENREKWRNWLQNHLWCPNDPRGQGIDDDDDDDGDDDDDDDDK